MKRLIPIVLLLAGCATTTPPPPAPPPAPLAMEGPAWRLTSIDGAPTNAESRMVFRDGKISGQGPCNSLRGSYAKDGSAFSIDAILSTKMACPALEEENRMLDGLLLAENASLTGEVLEIGSPKGPILTFDLADG